MNLTIYNSLERKKTLFQPINPADVRIYACGPTVYNYAHIGNARMAVVVDLLVRVLRELYPKVTYVSNITDIDDKIIKAAADSGEEISTITTKYAKIYNEDMAILGVALPDIQPYATEHLPEMIALTEQLITKEHAYVAEGHVLFHVPSFPAHGKLSGRDREQQIAGSRVEVAPYKKDPADFVLWKPSTEDQPGWESPWGFGRPGWHLECSAMAEKHLGLPFDIHAGGMDLTFPHHENEIAQSCCAHDSLNDPKGFVRYWVHNGFVTMDDEKMSKSLGNIQLVHQLIQNHHGETLRLALLSAHYRQPLNWNQTSINQAKSNLDRLYRQLYELTDIKTIEGSLSKDFLSTLVDDLNTPKAIAEINKLSSALAKASREDQAGLKAKLIASAQFLGILNADPAQWLGYTGASNLDEAKILQLIEDRRAARTAKDFAKADQIRDELQAMGIEIEDSAGETIWRTI